MIQMRAVMTIMLKHQNDPELHPEVKQVMLTGPDARALAFLGRLDADLQRAAKRCQMYGAEVAKESPDQAILEVTADGAFIAYGRLDEGVGGKFPRAVLDQLNGAQLADHKWALAIRNKFVGHSVNALNHAACVADISGRRAAPELLDTFVADFRVILPANDIERLEGLVNVVRQKLAPLMEDARRALVTWAEENIETIVDNPPLQVGLVLQKSYDYFASRGELTGRFDMPGLY